MEIRLIEVFLEVKDYKDSGNAFIAACEDKEAAEEKFRGIVKMLNATANIRRTKFVEFDSNNITHANAYFEIEYESDFDLNEMLLREVTPTSEGSACPHCGHRHPPDGMCI